MQSLQPQPVAFVEQSPRDQSQAGQRAQSGADGDQEHDHDLVFHRLDRVGPGQDLAGHHPRQADQPGGGHGIDDGDEAAARRLALEIADRLGRGRTQHQPALDLLALLPGRLGQPVHGNGDAVHGVAQQHAQQRDGVLGRVPGIVADDHPQGEQGDGERRQEHGEGPHAEAPPAGQAPALAHHHLAPGDAEHEQRDQADEGRVGEIEQPFQHQADEQQLHRGAQGGDQDLVAQLALQPPGQEGQQQHQQRGQSQIPVAQMDHPACSSRMLPSVSIR